MLNLISLFDISNPEHAIDLSANNQFNLPCNAYIKDLKGNYLACNDVMARYEGYDHSKDLAGMTDYDLCSEKEAQQFRMNDREIIKNNIAKVYFERIVRLNRSILFISQKVPLYSNSKKIIGIVGLSLVQYDNQDLLTHNLTLRQIDCLRHLAQGMTAKQIANKLFLSVRTVEHHIAAIKLKLHCTSRHQFVEKARQLNLID